jgi:Mrp family chromosome partitioning ATPase
MSLSFGQQEKLRDSTPRPEILGGTSFVSSTGRIYHLFGNEDEKFSLPAIPAIPPLLAPKKASALSLDEALQQIDTYSTPVEKENRLRSETIPPTIQLVRALEGSTSPKIVKREGSPSRQSLPARDIVEEVMRSTAQPKDAGRQPLRVIGVHGEEPVIVPFGKPAVMPETSDKVIKRTNVPLKVVRKFSLPIHCPKVFQKYRMERWNREKKLYRKPWIQPAVPVVLHTANVAISPPLSPWERARVRAENERACRPHPNPPPTGEGTKKEQFYGVSQHIHTDPQPVFCEQNPSVDLSTFQWSAQLDLLMQSAHDQIRMLTDHLVVQSNQATKVICFKSVFPGDGCSTILLCAVRALTERQHRVLLIDAHHRHIDLPNQLNLAENLDTGNGVMTVNESLDLWVWQQSKSVEENTALLAKSMTNCREKYDLVVLDCGSLTESPLTEFVNFWNQIEADGIVLVSNTKHPSEIPLSHIAGRLRQHHIHLIGITENCV